MDERRFYGLDALRGAMMMLGIVLHGAGFYLAFPPTTLPIVTDRNTSPLLDILFHFIHSFRMPTFFVMAGFFAALLIEKRGLIGTWKNRAARILAPFLVALVTILPFTGLFAVSFMVSARYGGHQLIPDVAQVRILFSELAAAGFPLDQPSPGHLWFLYYLLYFYLLIPLCRALVSGGQRFAPGIGKLFGSAAMLPLLGLYTAATLWPFHGGQVQEGFLFFKPHLPSLIYYGSFFVLGYWFHYYQEVLEACVRYLPWCAIAAAGLFPLALYLSHLDNLAASATFGSHLAAVLINALCTWALVFAFVGAFMRYFDRASPWTLYTSQSSYWVFLVHMPLACIACWWLVQYDVPALFKFVGVVAFTTVFSFLSYHYWVQKTWVSAFLNGRRFDMQWPWRGAGVIVREGHKA